MDKRQAGERLDCTQWRRKLVGVNTLSCHICPCRAEKTWYFSVYPSIKKTAINRAACFAALVRSGIKIPNNEY